MTLISSLSIILIPTLLVAIDARGVLPSNVTIPAVIGFGDSLLDPGNNNHIPTLVKCNFPPYGRDFAKSVPTGRFSNGKIPTDLLAEKWGVKTYLPAYLEPNLTAEELLTGVSFASGGAGYDPLTSTAALALSLPRQLDLYKEYIGKLRTTVGPNRTDFIIRNGVHLLIAGNNDIAVNYFGPLTPFRRTQYDFNSYADFLLTYASSFVKELYSLGARRIVVFSAPPVGCVPLSRTLGGGWKRTCAENNNVVAKMFNSKLITELKSLQSSLLDSKIVYADIYTPVLDIVLFPSKYGFEEVARGCCGTGLIEAAYLCNKHAPVCSDQSKYVFWDSAHPTEKAYRIILEAVINNITDLI